MKRCTMSTLILAALLAVLCLSPGPAQADAPAKAVIYMVDGREFAGEILNETATEIRFRVVDTATGIASEITLYKDQIHSIKRLTEEEAAEAAPSKAASAKTTKAAESTKEVDMSLPGIYIVPIRGTMGTDISSAVYDDIIEDIKRHDPAVIVFRLNSNFLDEPESVYIFEELDDYRALVNNLKNRLRGYRQVMWVEDSIGISSVLALAWEELYMFPEANLDGLVFVHMIARSWSDPDVRAKMTAAWTGIMNGFLQHGRYDPKVGEAMMLPEKLLSATFKGREVMWAHNTAGEVVVDSDDERTAGFDAEEARNLRICQEITDDLQDLAFLLGYREFREIDGIATKSIDDWISGWRDTFAKTESWMKDAQQYLGWANGDQTLTWLGKAKSTYEAVIRAMEKYPPVEKEWARRGLTKLELELRVRALSEQMRGIRRGGGGGGGGGGGLNPPGGGGGGGGPG